MSAELVRRLRLGFFSDVATEIASKAADEIERLTAERDALSAQQTHNRTVITQLEGYVGRLESQLRAAGEQEPVAWMETGQMSGAIFKQEKHCIGPRVPLYRAPAPVPQPQEARDAERYRYIRDNAKDGAVKTLLPLYRAHYFVSLEPVSAYPTFDAAIDAAILAAKEKSDETVSRL